MKHIPIVIYNSTSYIQTTTQVQCPLMRMASFSAGLIPRNGNGIKFRKLGYFGFFNGQSSVI